MIEIRTAEEADAEELLAIYRPYVEETAITFEYDVPSVEEFKRRIRETKKRYPYLTAVCDGELAGYAYASPFKERAAYDWSVETSIYVKMDKKRLGIGKMLYEKLEELLGRQGILNVNACIAYPKENSTHLTMDSVYFHKKLGYQMVGTFHDSGYKFKEWYDMVWMEKMIGEHKAGQPDIILFPQLEKLC